MDRITRRPHPIDRPAARAHTDLLHVVAAVAIVRLSHRGIRNVSHALRRAWPLGVLEVDSPRRGNT